MQISSQLSGGTQPSGKKYVKRSNGSILWAKDSSSHYFDSSDFTRDKFSGPRPKAPRVKLTPMTKVRAFETHVPMDKGTVRASSTVFYEISGWYTRDISYQRANANNLVWWYSWLNANPGQDFADYENRLLLSADAKVQEPDFDTPVFLAELGETLSMLRHPFRDLHRFIKKRKSVRSILDFTGGQWLKYRYGIRPLLGDVDTICSLTNGVTTRYADVRRKASAYGRIVTSESEETFMRQPNSYCILQVQQKNVDAYTVNCSHYYNWNKTVYSPLLGNSGGLATLAGVVWELIPYSFVVDWFLNVGDYIASFKVNPRIDHRGYTTTVVRTRMQTTRIIGSRGIYSTYPQIYPVSDANQYTFGIETKLRSLPSKPVSPVLNWDYNDVLHVVDGLTLTFQKLLGKRS